MSKTSNLSDLLKVYEAADQVTSANRKLEILTEYIETLDGVEKVKVFGYIRKSEVIVQEASFQANGPVSPEGLEKRIPLRPGTMTLGDELKGILGEKEWEGQVLTYPVRDQEENLLGVLFLRGPDLPGTFAAHDMTIRFLCSKVKEILENDFLKDRLGKEDDLLKLFIHHKKLELDNIFSWESSQLINWINLPLYIANLEGKFVYANKVFLQLLGLESLEQLLAGYRVFPDPSQREREMSLLMRHGRVDSFKITVTRADGVPLAIRDSALIMGTSIFGFFFDVTELVRLNKELKEALGMQEFLNDKLISSSLLLQKTQATTIRSLAKLAEYRDRETGDHLDRIGNYSAILVQEIYRSQPYAWRITEKYLRDLIVSSMLHDIGKVGVPDSILLKPGALSEEEFKILKNHTLWGWAILNQADQDIGEQSYLTLAAAIALNHHERYDGTGYPHGLTGEEIPLSARIEALADVYDALTTTRPYKEAWSHERAVEEILSQKGKQFDPIIVEIFREVEDRFYKISRSEKEE